MKRFVSMVLILTMILALGVTAYAADEAVLAAEPKFSITINNAVENHTYEAYQIFAGKLHVNEEGSKILSDIQWGSGVTADGQSALGNAAEKAEFLQEESDAADFAKEVVSYLDAENAILSTAVGNGTYTIENLESGYYLIKDKDNSVQDHDAYTSYILQVVGDVNVKPKSSVPQVEKKIKDTNDSTDAVTDWQDSADYDIGDEVSFQLKATLADNVSSYENYKVVFHDTLSAGLTYQSIQKITIDGTDVTDSFTVNDSEENKLTISCNDVKVLGAGNHSVITVEYTAKLNDKAVLGSAGNPNTVYLEFFNNPNWVGDGENSPTGNTPEDKVIVFTYMVQIDKVNENDEPLEGAGFTLYKKYADESSNDGYRAVGEEKTGITTFEWSGLDDGEYKLVETTTPDGYNTMDDILFEIAAKHAEESDNPTLIELVGGDKFTGNIHTGVLNAKVVNKPGVKLPSTGGMGTTVFYIVGGILVLTSGAVLLMNKRKNNNT